MTKLLLILSFIAVGEIVWAEPSPQPQYEEAIRKISQVREALKLSTTSSNACTTPIAPNCTFESYCSKFADKGQNFYLYQNEEGRQVPNFQMIINLRFAESCLRKPFPQAVISDPFAYPEQLIDEAKAGGKENLKRNLERYNLEVNRAQKIYRDTQSRILALLEKRRTPSNSAAISNMIKRVKMTNFTSPKLGNGLETLSSQGCELPNAFYSPAQNEVTICPQLLNLPDASLVATIAHELGHSIDPCTMVHTYSKNSEGKIELNSPAYLDGVDTTAPRPEIQAVPAEQNPLKSIISCLQSPSSIGAKTPSKKDLIADIDREQEALRAETADERDGELGDTTLAIFEDRRRLVREHYTLYQHCGQFTNNGHMQEAFSDWLSAQILSEKVSGIGNTEKARQYAFESQAVFWGTGCDNIRQATTQRIQQSTGPQCPTYEETLKQITSNTETRESTHPPTADRLNRITFAKPEIQRALGCKPGANGNECK